MSFDYKLAKEIYGVPWSVDAVSFLSLSSILRNIQNGVVLDAPDVKLNSISLLEIKNETRLIKNTWSLDNNDSFDAIGIINLNGPITKGGGMSSNGTKELSSKMLQMNKDARVKGFVMLTDSGGGASAAVSLMQDAINEVKQTKPVLALIEKGGMAGSAAYGIISACTGIYSEDGMNIVGSAGTMIQFSGMPNGTVDTDGEKHITLYATKSTAKNKGFEEAIENDNYKIIVSDLLDPINENFLQSILANRPILKGTNYDDGHTVFSKDAVGTFIDGIASFDEVVAMIITPGVNSNLNINSNTNKMNKSEIKSTYPDAYSEILQEGIAQEQERVNSWNAFKEIDSKAVETGIASGLPIKQSEVNSFIVKATQLNRVNDLNSDNAPAVVVEETTTVDNAGVNGITASKAAEIKAAFDF